MCVASQLQIQGRGPTPQGRGGNQLRFINALVDLRGDARDALGIQILSISCRFWKIWQNCILMPPGGSWHPPSGNTGSSIVMFLCSYNISSGNQNDVFQPLGLNIAVGFFPNFFRNFCMNCMLCLLPPMYVSRLCFQLCLSSCVSVHLCVCLSVCI